MRDSGSMVTQQKFALVTGASSGIGKAMARRLARAGYSLLLVSERDMELTITQAVLARDFPRACVETFVADLSVPSAARRLYETLTARHPRIDVLIHDSRIGDRGSFLQETLDEQLMLLRSNVESFTVLTRLVATDMCANGEGRILTHGLVPAFHNITDHALYQATQAFVVSLSGALAEEVAGSGVTVTCLCPPPTAAHLYARGDVVRTVADLRDRPPNFDAIAETAFVALMNGELVAVPDHITTLAPMVQPKRAVSRPAPARPPLAASL
jgi:short-subunit dehydrogenase